MKRKRTTCAYDDDGVSNNRTSDPSANHILSKSAMQLLNLLKSSDCDERLDSSQCESNKSAPTTRAIIVRRLLQKRDIAMHFFTSPIILHDISRWSQKALCNFLSILMEELHVFKDEYNLGDEKSMSLRYDVSHERDESGTSNLMEKSSSKTYEATKTPVCNDTFDPKRCNYLYLVLQFVKDLVMLRYDTKFPHPEQNSSSCSTDILTMIAHLWPHMDTCVVRDLDFEADPCEDNHPSRVEIVSEDWITCIIFMMSYTILYQRLEYRGYLSPSPNVDISIEETDFAMKEGNSATKPTLESDRYEKINADRILVSCISILYLLKITTINIVHSQRLTQLPGPTTLEKCFQSQLNNLDLLMIEIREISLSNGRKHFPTAPHIYSIKKKCVMRNFDELWHEVEIGVSQTEIDDENSGECLNFVDTQNDLVGMSQDSSRNNHEEKLQIDCTLKDTTGIQESLDMEVCETRRALLNLPKNASSAEIQCMATSIADLMNLAIIRRYSPTSFHSIGNTLVEGNGNGQKISIPDEVISKLCSLCITEQTSEIRVSAFMTAFIYPSIEHLRAERSRSASRLFASTVINLSKQRPAESIKSLLLPSLCVKKSVMNNEKNDAPPSQAQCEFIGQIIRSATFPHDVLSRFVSNLLVEKGGIHWNEHTVPLLTNCLQKKPLLSDETILNLSNHILKCSTDISFCKSVKFATLVHTFVSKFGRQISKSKDKSTSVGILHDSAVNLKTLMGKAILAVIKKL